MLYNKIMDKLKMQSLDVIGSNIKRIQQLFPNCVTERIGKDGKPEMAIDFDKLKAELINDVMEEGEERYQFTWPGKRAASRLANEATTQTLRPCREESVDFDNTLNLYIEGDNLEVLKVLRETYLGKVKMIYIDPPYNTGNDFVYNDDFTRGKTEFEQNSGLFDEEGNQTIDPMQRNTEKNGRFHTDWLNMIYPRLKVAKDLLKDDGVIFISIDDNEVENLKKVCNEVFGEKNFVCNLIWQSTPGSNTGTDIKTITENVLLYCKNKPLYQFGTQKIQDTDKYDNKDEYFNKRGGYVLNKLDRRMTGPHYSESLNYAIAAPDGSIFFPGGQSYKQEHWNWRWSKNKLEWGIVHGFIVFKNNNGCWSVYFKQYEKVNNDDEPIERTVPYQNLLTVEGANSARGTREVMNLFDGKLFDYPKPLALLDYLLKVANLNKDSIILDFFSGSATTAHAVMQLNAEDNGNRKFIMVQLPELTDEKSEAYKAGYKNICEIGKERIRRAGKKIKEESPLTTQDLDTGFRVLKLDSSNMNDVYYTPEEFSLNTLFSENVKEDRTAEDLLFQVMLDLGIELAAKIEKQEIAGKEVFLVDENYLIACFDKDVNETTITEIAKMHPVYFVMRDASAASDNVIDNFDQLFEAYSKDTVRKIL